MIQNSINQMLATMAVGTKLAGYNKLGEEMELKNLGNQSSAIDEIVRRHAEDPTAEGYGQRVGELERQQEAIELRQAELGGTNVQGINEGREGIEYAKSRIPTQQQANAQAAQLAQNQQQQAANYSKAIELVKNSNNLSGAHKQAAVMREVRNAVYQAEQEVKK